jgi:hypothetical protein
MPNSLEHLGIPPIRGWLVNDDFEDSVDSLPSSMEMFFNPDQLTFNTGAEWARIAVPGLSHEVLQYSHTNSNELKFNLEWDLLELARRQKAGDKKEDSEAWFINPAASSKPPKAGLLYKEFLYALTLPIEAGRAPSRITIVWPGVVHVRCVVEDVKFTFTRFGKSGGVIAFGASLDLIELRRVFLSRKGVIDYFTRVPEDKVPPSTFDDAQTSEKIKVRRRPKGKKSEATGEGAGFTESGEAPPWTRWGYDTEEQPEGYQPDWYSEEQQMSYETREELAQASLPPELTTAEGGTAEPEEVTTQSEEYLFYEEAGE